MQWQIVHEHRFKNTVLNGCMKIGIDSIFVRRWSLMTRKLGGTQNSQRGSHATSHGSWNALGVTTKFATSLRGRRISDINHPHTSLPGRMRTRCNERGRDEIYAAVWGQIRWIQCATVWVSFWVSLSPKAPFNGLNFSYEVWKVPSKIKERF